MIVLVVNRFRWQVEMMTMDTMIMVLWTDFPSCFLSSKFGRHTTNLESLALAIKNNGLSPVLPVAWICAGPGNLRLQAVETVP